MNRVGWSSLVIMLVVTAVAVWQSTRDRQMLRKGASQGVVALDPFPGNMASITELIDNIQERLHIVADFCSYGAYSSPARFAEYESALIKRAAAGKQIELTIYTDTFARHETRVQFGLADTDPSKNQKTLDDMARTDKFKKYFDYHHSQPPTTPDEFIDVLQTEEDDCIAQLKSKTAVVHQTMTGALPVFTWIRDNDEAILSIPNFGQFAGEASLSTRNRTLLNLLIDKSKTP